MNQPRLPWDFSYSPLKVAKPVFNRIGIVISIMLITSCSSPESRKEGAEEKEEKFNTEINKIKVESDSARIILDSLQAAIDTSKLPVHYKEELRKDLRMIKEISEDLEQKDSLIQKIIENK